jgi:hypothetical protein
MMNCKDVQNLLSVYVDHECTITQKREIEEHIKDCKSCQVELEWLKSLISKVQELDEVDVPEGFHEDLMHRVHKTKDNSSKILPFKKRIRPAYSIVAAAFLLIVVFSVLGTQQLLRMGNQSTEMSKESVGYDQAVEEYTTETAEQATGESIEESNQASLRSSDITTKIIEESMDAKIPEEDGNSTVMINGAEEPSAYGDVQESKLKNSHLNDSTASDEAMPSDKAILADDMIDENETITSSRILDQISVILLILFPIVTLMFVIIFRKKRH